MWGTIGIGYNVAAVKERLGEDAPVDSWALVFDPQYAAKLADCGITMLDSSTDMLQMALRLSRARPAQHRCRRHGEGGRLLMQVRPYIRYFNSSQYISDLANGEVCVSVGFSGDVFIAAARAEEAGNGIEIAYSVPKEGAQQWFDMMAIPADAPNPEAAHRLDQLRHGAADHRRHHQLRLVRQRQRRLDAAGRRGDQGRPGDLPAGRGAREAVPERASTTPAPTG